MLLSVHLPLYRAEELDYPYREVVRSVYGVADEIVLLVHDSGDGTLPACRKLAREAPVPVRVFRHPWWNPERRQEALADATNFCIERCRGRYHLALQADEALHESQHLTLRGICFQDVYPWAEFGRLNFCGTFDRVNANIHRWPRSVVRLARRDLYPAIRSYGDATHLGVPDTDPARFPRLDARDLVQLWHYSYVRAGRAYVERQYAMADLYGLPRDPRIEKWDREGRIIWEEMVPTHEGLPPPGQHPQVMWGWIAAHREAVLARTVEKTAEKTG